MTNNTPAVRFEGFSREWEERIFFENIQSTIDFRGRTPKKIGLDWSEDGYLALSALNVKKGFIDFNSDAHYGSQELYDKWMGDKKLTKGQVLFTTEAPMGNVAQVPDDKGYILSQRTVAFEVNKEKMTNDFLATLFRSPNIFNKLTSLSSGGTAKGVSQRSLAKLKVTVPIELEEQSKIGSFFKQLDDTIALQQQELDTLKQTKQGFLQKMFPKEGETVPEVRFEGFSGKWDEKKLGEIATLASSKRIHLSDYVEKGIPFYRGSEISSGAITGQQELFISENLYQEIKSKYGVPKENDILVTAVGTLGNLWKIDTRDFYYKDGNLIQIGNISQNSDYIYSYLNDGSGKKKLLDSSAGSNQKALTMVKMREVRIPLPKVQEQSKIGSFFKQIDDTIALHQQELEVLKETKQAFLQKMFV